MTLDEEIAFWRNAAEASETDAWMVAMGMALGLAGDAAQNMKAEIERLRAKITEWEKVYAQCDQSRDEITDKMSAKVERLKAALRALLAHDYAEECQECGIGRSAAWKNAHAALEGEDVSDTSTTAGASGL